MMTGLVSNSEEAEGTMSDFTTSFAVEGTPHDVFDAINDVRGWWGEDVNGSNDKVGDEFTNRVWDVHDSKLRYSKLRVTELIPNEKVVWLVLDNPMNVVGDPSGLIGTTISFEITGNHGTTEVRFAHRGANSKDECFDVCSNICDFLMPSLTAAQATLATGWEQFGAAMAGWKT
jgi:hypothetical protein